ncbi:hypothetical protein E3O55_09915 [Cryobacterium sp. MDB1-18-2]|uniref:hypothetical protein n=1 Tax=unclassified Cryobacterium TaxID=2649013 RepID=UPI0010696EA9|nr:MULTISPECIES: hypothetical protein [unclassified Cryobacterium]TFC29181.1 hypothetical protein E3O55_09915 [Cryobacterium sp. MDB1-18-2]TFC45543.1 hypothetical protein E3O50_03585 [Cryobacterium sp. MDB1-18-1]
MNQITSTNAYIEEYMNEQGQVSARLREKVTRRKVDLGLATAAGKQDFLRFLNAAGANKTKMPDVFSEDGDEGCVAVSGNVDFDGPDEIRFIYNENLSYLFA